MIIASDTNPSGTIYEVETRKPIGPDDEGFIPYHFRQACTLERVVLSEDAVLLNVMLGEQDLGADVASVPVKAGAYLVLNVRNAADIAQDITAEIHVRDVHGPEAARSPFTIFNGGGGSPSGANGAHEAAHPEQDAPRTPRSLSDNDARRSQVVIQSIAAELASPPRGIDAVQPQAVATVLAPEPTASLRWVGKSDIILYREDAEALLRAFEYSSPISDTLRASLNLQFLMAEEDTHTNRVLSPENEVILILAPSDAEMLADAIQFRQEYHLEDTGILIQALQSALEGKHANEGVVEAETQGAQDEAQVDVMANEGSLLSIAEEVPGHPVSDEMTEIIDEPDSGDEETPGKITPNDGRTEKDGESR